MRELLNTFIYKENLEHCFATLYQGVYRAVMSNNPLIKRGKAVFEVFLVNKRVQQFSHIYFIMSWKTTSTDSGLAGLTPEEAAKGALFWEEFQNMPDPLDDPRSVLRVSLN